jgi:hypothetical protein
MPQDEERHHGTARRVNGYTISVLCVLGFGSLTYGYTASIIGTTLGLDPWRRYTGQLLISTGQPSFIKYFELDTRPNGTNLIASMNGVFEAGGVIGTLMLPIVADSWGRRWACAVVGHMLWVVSLPTFLLTLLSLQSLL